MCLALPTARSFTLNTIRPLSSDLSEKNFGGWYYATETLKTSLVLLARSGHVVPLPTWSRQAAPSDMHRTNFVMDK